jgi:beta-lactamase regulating signal transducer with metallopeptidase domain
MTTPQLLREIGSPALVRGVGYALLHSLWQGGVLALLLAGVLPLLRRQRAEVRYAAAAGGLASLVLVVGLTFGWYYQSQPVAVPAVTAATTLASEAIMPSQLVQASGATPLAVAAADSNLPISWLQANRHQLEAYLPLVVVAWLLGLLLMSGRLAGGLLYANRLRRAGTQALGAEWQQRLAALAHRAGVRQPVALLESARVAGPMVLGHLRPVILLPLGAVAGLSPALLEALLAHELAHIVRRDYLLNLGLAVAEVLFFYHPAVWFMANCLRAERENCCDDQAAALCGGDGLRVARALAALAELEAATAPMPRLALAAAGSGGRGSLLARVRRLALGRPQAPTMSERLLAGSLTLVGLLGLSTGVVLAARPAQTAPGQTALADTARRVAAALPAIPAIPALPSLPSFPALPGLPGLPPLPDTLRRMEKSARVFLNDDNEPEGRIRRWRQEPPRRGQARTVVIEKDKKGRVVNLTVDGQRIETDTPGKKNKHGKPVRTVEVVMPIQLERRVEVVRTPGQLRRIERLELPETPELLELPERSELPESRSFSFDFSTDEVTDKAVLAARRALAEALRNPDLNTEERQEMQKELRKLEKDGLNTRVLRNGRELRELHLNLDLSGSATSHAAHPSYRLERTKRGYARMKFDKAGRLLNDPAQAEANARRAEVNGRLAEANGRRAEANGRLAEANARLADANGRTAEANARQAEVNARRAELRARMAAAAAELRALDNGGPQVPAPPRAPQAPRSPQAPPAPPAPAAPKTDKLRAALRQDGLIGKSDRSFSFELNDKGGRVNGQALTPAQVARYRQLMGQPASGKGQSSTFNINVNEN